MSYKFFIESLRHGGFLGTFCVSEQKFAQGGCEGNVKLPMFFEDVNKKGTYFLKTQAGPHKNEEMEKYLEADWIEEMFI